MGIEMGKEQGPTWYDECFAKDPLYSRRYKSVHYYPLWRELEKYITDEYGDPSIVELGCGVGQFAQMMYDLRHSDYKGYDFSPYAIKEAKSKCPLKFYQQDITNPFYIDADLVIILETMEHIKDDLSVFKNIKKDTGIIITVPKFDGTSHVRFFKSEAEVRDRYSDFVDIEKLWTHSNYIALCGKRK